MIRTADNNVSIINTRIHKVIKKISVGSFPIAQGLFITNEVPERAVPTLGEWGAIALVGILGLSGLIAIRGRLMEFQISNNCSHFSSKRFTNH